jgi:hypothetical protein
MEFLWFLAGFWIIVIALSYATGHDKQRGNKNG